jgi:hypothetical protein
VQHKTNTNVNREIMDRILPDPVNKAITHFLYNVVYPLEKYAAPTVVLGANSEELLICAITV